MMLLKLIKISRLSMFCLGVLLVLSLSSEATVLSVALDGSQPYTSIQTAINASAHGDTVLVYPGRYYENVSFNGKNIVLGSLEMITGNRDYICSTIIDASFTGAGVTVGSREAVVTFRGFSVVNGTGLYTPEHEWTTGGGILVYNMTGQKSVKIINCHITGNRADNGGGVFLGRVQAYLSGVSIHHNRGIIGAGIYFDGCKASTIAGLNRGIVAVFTQTTAL